MFGGCGKCDESYGFSGCGQCGESDVLVVGVIEVIMTDWVFVVNDVKMTS